ncbi:MAG: M1 family metallopeptidase [Bacteroidota bacterium]
MAPSDPHSYSDLSQGRIKRIDFDIAVDFASRTLRVRADYQLEAPVSGDFFLDSRGVSLTGVSSGGVPVRFELDAQDPILGERLCLKNLENADGFTIELNTSPAASALQWLEPQQTAGGVHPFLYSQCQALHARSLFPCQDTPSVRFTYGARLRVPRHLAAVMAAASTGVTEQGEAKICSFSMPQPIPSYLFALAVGDLRFKELGPRTGVYAEPSVLEAAAWEFAENERKVEEAERLFGPYLWDRYDLLIMPPSFPYGGMENPRLSFITQLAVLGTRERTALISHELAHAWTGNLVTNATWEDFWLNEGWTTYAEYRLSQALEGVEVTHLMDLYARNRMREQIKRLGETSERTCLKASMKGVDPDEAVSTIPYTKGRLFLQSLERAAGRETFDVFIHKYISRHSFHSLSTEGFIVFLEQELPAACERVDIHTWLYHPGYPEDAPPVTSGLTEEVAARAGAYERGILPTREDVKDWHYLQTGVFLDMLPRQIPPEHCRYLEEVFDFERVRNATLLMLFYPLCIRSGYREILPEVERFAEEVGNFTVLKPVYRALVQNDWSRELARPLFERVRERYHPITAAMLESVLTEGGV